MCVLRCVWYELRSEKLAVHCVQLRTEPPFINPSILPLLEIKQQCFILEKKKPWLELVSNGVSKSDPPHSEIRPNGCLIYHAYLIILATLLMSLLEADDAILAIFGVFRLLIMSWLSSAGGRDLSLTLLTLGDSVPW